MKKNTKRTLILFISFFLCSCGYQLQKNLSIDSNLQPIYIDGDRRLTLLLSRELSIANIEVTNTPTQAFSTIKIKRKKSLEQPLTLNESGQSNQYSLTTQCLLSWKDNKLDAYIILPTNLSARRIQLQNKDNILGQYSMKEKLVEQLDIELIEKALYRINKN
tara:strand:- start:1110 stop:1595 length:486 start_codon:yes stop_codon:yes gene_type:complete